MLLLVLSGVAAAAAVGTDVGTNGMCNKSNRTELNPVLTPVRLAVPTPVLSVHKAAALLQQSLSRVNSRLVALSRSVVCA